MEETENETENENAHLKMTAWEKAIYRQRVSLRTLFRAVVSLSDHDVEVVKVKVKVRYGDAGVNERTGDAKEAGEFRTDVRGEGFEDGVENDVRNWLAL